MTDAELAARAWTRASGVLDPCSVSADAPMSIAEMGLLRDVTVDDGTVTVRMRLTAPSCPMVPYFLASLEQQLIGRDGIRHVRLETDGGMDWSPTLMSPQARRRQELRNARRLIAPRRDARGHTSIG